MCIRDRDKAPGAPARDTLAATAAAVEAELDRRLDELEKNVHYQVIPIKKLVSVQLESALVAARYVNGKDVKEI